MSNYCCNAVGCSNSALKKNNVEKYPWLKDVKFRSFPHATREKTTIVDSSASTRTGQDPKQVFTGMFQTHENEKGPTSEHPIPTLTITITNVRRKNDRQRWPNCVMQ